MKILIEKHALVAALSVVAPIAASKGTIAILANVLLTAKNGKLTFRTTNLDMEIVAYATCAIEREGETTVNVSRLFDIARNMPAGAQILFDLGADDPRMKVSSGRSRFMLPVVTPRDFPMLEAQKYPINMTMTAEDLSASISRTQWAQSNESTRYYLCGVHMLSIDGLLRFEASNGHVVGVADMRDIKETGINAILPSSAVAAISRLVDGRKDEISLSLSDGRVSLTVGGVTLSSKLIDGGFPEISRVIPRDLPNVARVDADALADAVKRVAGVSDAKIPAVSLTLSENMIAVSVRGADGEEGYDEIECVYEGPGVKAIFTTDYIASAIAALNADVISMAFKDEMGGQIWRSTLNDDAMALLMPRRA